MALQQWAIPHLSPLLPLDEAELRQIITYTDTLPDLEAAKHLENLLGDSPQALEFITSFNERRSGLKTGMSKPSANGGNNTTYAPPPYPPPAQSNPVNQNNDFKQADETQKGNDSMFHPGNGATSMPQGNGSINNPSQAQTYAPPPHPPPQAQAYAPPPHPPPPAGTTPAAYRHYTNVVIEAGKVRAKDEQQMQNALQTLQMQYGIYNTEIEPEHDSDYYCYCPIHNYKRMKWNRYGVQDMWSKAVMYPGEKAYNDNQNNPAIFSSNPYQFRVISPYGNMPGAWAPAKPTPKYHAQSIHQTIAMNNSLNEKAQASINAKEPQVNIWEDNLLESAMEKMALGDKKRPIEQATDEKRKSLAPPPTPAKEKTSRLSSFRKSIGIKSAEERTVSKAGKMADKGESLRNQILAEEQGRWPDHQWRYLVAVYQEKVGMSKKIADLRLRHPIQYLHLLRAGYFEPIPVAWANQISNPLKFSIEPAAGWRGITPNWRGYEDTAEERLYWVMNHREGSVGLRMKPDFISAMDMARARMASAVEPPPEYYSANDTCHLQHTSAGYSKQVMPSAFRPSDRPEVPTDDTMILLDVSGSMDFEPVRPNYNQYLITGYSRSTQPKNKDVAKAIIRRFTDAMAHHDHEFRGYDLSTFSSQADYIGTVNHQNLDTMWQKVKLGGGTRVMTGWQKVKDLHFQKHSESATHHPVYGWQAGPQTPMLRLLLLLDGEATDMDEFELDLLGLSWAHVTIFLIGVDGCPHHHRHANELQRISDVNHHVSFVDAQGNTPERFVTHELLKRHLGYDISMAEFVEMEELPAYQE